MKSGLYESNLISIHYITKKCFYICFALFLIGILSNNKADKTDLDNIPLILNQSTDILAYALACPRGKRTSVRIHSSNAVNNPFGVTSDTDFIYNISKIAESDNWLSIEAKDIRTNAEFINTLNNGVWLGWQKLLTLEKPLINLKRVRYPLDLYQNSMSLTELCREKITSGYKFLCWTSIASDGWIMQYPIYFAAPQSIAGFPFTHYTKDGASAGEYISFYFLEILAT